MLIGRIRDGGRPVVAYETIDEIVDTWSCIACMFYNPDELCVYYGECRADKSERDHPIMFMFVGRDNIFNRMTMQLSEVDKFIRR